MPWFKVDDKLHSNKKPARANLAAMGLWVLAGSWCAENFSTEGFVPDYIVKRLDPDGVKHACDLMAARLWTEVEDHDGDHGWIFHDWLEYQFSAEQVENERRKSRERMQKLRRSSGDVRANNGRTSGAVRKMYNDPEPEPEPEVPSELLDARSRAKSRARKKPEHPIPDDWQPTDKHRAYAEENGIDLDGEAFRFRNHAESKDRRCVRWDAAFSNWLSKSDRRQPPQRDFRDSASVVNLDDPANWRVMSND